MSWEYLHLRRELSHNDHPKRRAFEDWCARTWQEQVNIWWMVTGGQHQITDDFLSVSRHDNLLKLRSHLLRCFGQSAGDLWPIPLPACSTVLVHQQGASINLGLMCLLRDIKTAGAPPVRAICWSDGKCDVSLTAKDRLGPSVREWLDECYPAIVSQLPKAGRVIINSETVTLDAIQGLESLAEELVYDCPSLKARRDRMHRMHLPISSLQKPESASNYTGYVQLRT